MRTSRAVLTSPFVPQRRLARVVALGVAGLLLAGCSATADSGAAEGSTAMPMPASVDKGYDSAQSGAGGAADGSGNGAVTGDEERMVVVSGSVTVVVKDPIDAVDEVASLVDRAGGFVAGRQQQSAQGDQEAWATITARIPADKLTGVISDLEKLGTVDSTQLTSTEVTAQAEDLDARIAALQLSIDRLTELLARSGDLADIVQAEQVLTDRQSQLEQLQSQRASLADQVAMSTVEIGLRTEEERTTPSASGFLGGLESGWNALVVFLGTLVTVLGVLLPWLAVLAVVGLALWPVARRSRRRSAERAAAARAALAARQIPPATAYERLQMPVPVGVGVPAPAAPAPQPAPSAPSAPPAAEPTPAPADPSEPGEPEQPTGR